MQNVTRLLSAMLLLLASAYAQKSVITVAGGYLGDHKPALAASFALPVAVTLDAEGNLYIGDADNCRIRKINRQGTVTTFAGTGICGFGGDGGRATAAMLSAPYGLAVDAHGNLFFSDTTNQRIREINTSGVISTVAGNGSVGYSGDGGPATQASVAYPEGLALDGAGNLYIADTNNYVVRLVDSAGIIHNFAGNHSPGYSGDGGPATAAQIRNPFGVAVDQNGNVYIAEDSLHVRKVDSAGVISTIAGNGGSTNTGDGGPAISAAIGSIRSIALSNNGLLYISTVTSIWSVDLATNIIHLIAGISAGAFGFGGDGGPASSALLSNPTGLAVDSPGNLLIADSGNNRIREIVAGSQVMTTLAGGFLGDGHAGRDASLNLNFGAHLAFDPGGNLYIADTYNNRIRELSPKGIIATVAGNGTTGYSGDGGPATAAQLSLPSAVVADSLGNIFIADSGNGVVRKVDSSGTITTLPVTGTGIFGRFLFGTLTGMALDSLGNLYVCDGFSVVWKVDSSAHATIFAGTLFGIGYGGDGLPATQAALFFPTGVAVDSAGNVYIADWLNDRIRKVYTNGIITTVAGNGSQFFSGDGGPATSASLGLPTDVAVDAAGNIYTADWINFRIRVVDSAGIIQTFAGSGLFAYNGERLPASQTNMFPIGVAVSPSGQVYFADFGSYRVRKIEK